MGSLQIRERDGNRYDYYVYYLDGKRYDVYCGVHGTPEVKEKAVKAELDELLATKINIEQRIAVLTRGGKH